jgi:hypothetical protein
MVNSPPVISFDSSHSAAIERFRAEREKILAAVDSRLLSDTALEQCLSSETARRLALESAKIFIENFTVSVKYGLPQAILDYLDWLRGFLQTRGVPQAFIPRMIHAAQIASQAFLSEPDADIIAGLLRDLRKRQRALIEKTR